VPANATATAHLPVPAHARVTEGGKPLDRAPGVSRIGRTRDAVTCELVSGRFRFSAEWSGKKV
jgi:hypothetical protein